MALETGKKAAAPGTTGLSMAPESVTSQPQAAEAAVVQAQAVTGKAFAEYTAEADGSLKGFAAGQKVFAVLTDVKGVKVTEIPASVIGDGRLLRKSVLVTWTEPV